MAPQPPTQDSSTLNLPCDDIVQFKKQLESARRVDDRIQGELNSRLPSSVYFRSKVDPRRVCEELFASLRCAHGGRESAIKRCISLTDQEVRAALNAGGESCGGSGANAGKAQSRLRQLRNDLYEEEIIQRNTYKFLYERCRDIYVPTDLPSEYKFS